MVFPTSQFSAFNVGKNSSLVTHGSLHVHLWGGREGWSNFNESCHSTNETAKKNNKSHMSEESLNDSILKPNLTSFNMMKTSFLSRPEVAFRSYCCEKISPIGYLPFYKGPSSSLSRRYQKPTSGFHEGNEDM